MIFTSNAARTLVLAALLLTGACQQPQSAESKADAAADAEAKQALATENKVSGELEMGVHIRMLEKRVDELEKTVGELQAKQEIKDALVVPSDPLAGEAPAAAAPAVPAKKK